MTGCLIIVPTLNEARHIGGLLDQLTVEADALDATIAVVDGGSTDRTREIVLTHAETSPRIRLLDNPQRIQSAAVNLAAARFGDSSGYLIRVDAHAKYPADYCRALMREAAETGADAIVVPMVTTGEGLFQRAVATAQNSLVGTGGSSHRNGRGGRWVDHGHHALMRVAAFRAVNGYDESFSYNEDAELDHRLRLAGSRIWLSGKTTMTYFPRETPAGLFRQYFGYGGGRARNLLKHRVVPKIRQIVPLTTLPAVALAGLAFAFWPALLPAAAWIAASLVLGVVAARTSASAVALTGAPLVSAAAMIMHLAWSAGFWAALLGVTRTVR
jgi:succinoglycan biosynthesis protein ExoA